MMRLPADHLHRISAKMRCKSETPFTSMVTIDRHGRICSLQSPLSFASLTAGGQENEVVLRGMNAAA